MKKAALLLCLVLFFGIASTAYAQSGDISFGVSGLTAPGASVSTINSGNYFAPTEGGGTYLNFSGDFLLRHHLGVEGEIAWRATQNSYLGYQPYRPVFYDFGAIWTQRYGKFIAPELSAGIGAESIRFYNNYYNCSYFSGCTNYTSSTHFLVALGGGLKLYPFHNFFVRPEVRFYEMPNNVEFASDHAVRVGVSIGYTFGGD